MSNAKPVPRVEWVLPHPIRCYDKGGKTADRYTVVYLVDQRKPGVYGCRWMSAHPFHPQGVYMYSECMLGRHLGQRIAFADLPIDCQTLVRQDLR